MEIKGGLRTLTTGTGIFKTLISLNPDFMRNIFSQSTCTNRDVWNLQIP